MNTIARGHQLIYCMFKAIRLAGQMMNYAPGHQAIRADDVTLVAASDHLVSDHLVRNQPMQPINKYYTME